MCEIWIFRFYDILNSSVLFLKEYQTLITGILAIIAALITVKGTLKAAQMPIIEAKKYQDKLINSKKKYVCSRLSEDLKILSERAKHAKSVIKVVINTNTKITDKTREQTTLYFPFLIDDWESMSLLDDNIIVKIMDLRKLVFQHNFDMKRAGGAFGADNFREIILQNIKAIEDEAMAISKIF